MNLLRGYETPAKKGYPAEWWKCPDCRPGDSGCATCRDGGSIRGLVRDLVGHRCVRCLHPFIVGAGYGQWSPCDERCNHGGPVRYQPYGPEDGRWLRLTSEQLDGAMGEKLATVRLVGLDIEAEYRILTVHHLDGNKLNCRWWNLAALCQRCHLTIQGKVVMERRWLHEHSPWFKPYVAGYYAWSILGEDLSREETVERLDELLELEARQMELEAS